MSPETLQSLDFLTSGFSPSVKNSHSANVSGIAKAYYFCVYFFDTRPAPKNEDEMMLAIFEYIDRYLQRDTQCMTSFYIVHVLFATKLVGDQMMPVVSIWPLD